MALEDYICSREGRSHYSTFDGQEYNYVVNYMQTSPRVVETVSAVNYAPYIDKTTNTWWEYDLTQEKFINTGISVISNLTEEQLQNAINTYLSDINISQLNNDAGYITQSSVPEDDDHPMTIEEVRSILDT